MEVYPVIYKFNSSGKTLIWYLERDGANYRTVSGQEDGKKTTSKWTTAKPKNTGKINATTAEEQAHKECLAKYEKKLSREYVDDKSKLGSLAYTKPMLAEPYYHVKPDGSIVDNRPHDFNMEAYYVQYKLDGSIHGSSKLITKEGLKTIKEIVENKLFIDVLSYNEHKKIFEYKPILGHSGETSSNFKEWKDIYINNLHYLKCTYDHPIYTNNGWKQAQYLDDTKDTLFILNMLRDKQCKGVEYKYYFPTEGYITPALNEYKWVNFNIKNSRYCSGNITKYDIEVKDNHNFVANNIVVHNCRCLLNKNGMFSREGKPIISCPHIYNQVKHLFEVFPDLELDGELYNHNYKDNFNKLVSLIRKTKSEKEDLEESAKIIHYFVYDLASHTKASYKDRRDFLNLLPITDNISTLLAYPVTSREEIDKFLYEALNEGYEGIMVRKGSGLYINKRTKNLLKYKKWEDNEFIIKDILEGQGNNSGIAAKIAIEVEGKIVYPNMTGTWDYCEQVLKEKSEYIGGEATVEYAGFTPDGSLRFPRVKSLYKTKRDF